MAEEKRERKNPLFNLSISLSPVNRGSGQTSRPVYGGLFLTDHVPAEAQKLFEEAMAICREKMPVDEKTGQIRLPIARVSKAAIVVPLVQAQHLDDVKGRSVSQITAWIPKTRNADDTGDLDEKEEEKLF